MAEMNANDRLALILGRLLMQLEAQTDVIAEQNRQIEASKNKSVDQNGKGPRTSDETSRFGHSLDE